MSLTPHERETVVNASDGDDLVRIWTAQRRYIGKLRRHPAFTEVGSGTRDGSEWAEFVIPADKWSPVGVKRSVSLTNEQRIEMGNRLRAQRGQDALPFGEA